MTPKSIVLAKILTYSGVLPFAAAIFLMFFPLMNLNPLMIAQTYGSIIVSFLCGIHWAVSIFHEEKSPYNLLIASNLFALLAWASLLTSPQLGLAIQSLCFISLLLIDLKLKNVGIVPLWFYELRRNATIIVVLSLLTVALFS